MKCHFIFKELQSDTLRYSAQKLRVWNEVATIFLIAIVFLVVLKDVMGLVEGLLGLAVVTVVLVMAIKIYRAKRLSNS